MERYYIIRDDGSVLGTPIKPAEGVNYTTDINEVVKPKKVPKEVSRFRLRSALIASNLLPSLVDDFIESITDLNEKARVYNLWNHATVYERNDIDLINISTFIFSLTSTQIDDIFILADSL